MTRYHVAQKGERKGQMVICDATVKSCPISSKLHADFRTAADAQNWNNINKEISNAEYPTLKLSHAARYCLSNGRSLSDSAMREIVFAEAANQGGGKFTISDRTKREIATTYINTKNAVAAAYAERHRYDDPNREVRQSTRRAMSKRDRSALHGNYIPETFTRKNVDWNLILKRHNESVSYRRKAALKAVDPEVLAEHAHNEDKGVRFNVAMNPNASAETLIEMSRDSELKVRRAVAANMSTPPKLLEEMYGKSPSKYGEYIASNPSVPTDLLDKLSGGVDSVRCQVANNESTSVETLNNLSRDSSPLVRSAVAANPNLSREAMESLSRDPSFRVRGFLYLNSAVPNDLKPELSDVERINLDALSKMSPCDPPEF